MEVPKGSIFQRPNNKYLDAYFIKSGILRSNTIDLKDKEHIFLFAPEGWTISEQRDNSTTT
jgi:hypothetical protein